LLIDLGAGGSRSLGEDVVALGLDPLGAAGDGRLKAAARRVFNE
jgi:hypothetical protein